MTICSVGILGTGHAVPERVLSNHYFENIVDTTDEWITSRTGIKERRVAEPELAASDLGLQAALAALDHANTRPEELDMIIVATITGDMPFPATSCIIQAKLGAVNAAAFDLQAGCSGFVYALETASRLVRDADSRVLVVGVDLLSRMTDYTDRSTCVLFGDGAGAAVLGQVSQGYGLLASDLGADGRGADFLKLPAGGSRFPATAETVASGQHYIYMAGNEVFRFAVRVMVDSTRRVMESAGLTAADIAWFIPHQANTRIIYSAAQKLMLDREKVYVNVDRFGNTSAASIGIALDELVQANRVQPGDHLLLVGFGAGLTWGSTIIRWGGWQHG